MPKLSEPESGPAPKVMAVFGKGGAGKTVWSVLAARTLLDAGVEPLLLVDADPSGGLCFAVGAEEVGTIGGVKERLVDGAAGSAGAAELAGQVDWLLLEALEERERYSILAMGRTESKGCFCPLNALLRAGIETLSLGFRAVIVDAEAGVEQLSRHLLRRVDVPVVVTDGSYRGGRVASQVAELLHCHVSLGARPGLVASRATLTESPSSALDLWGTIPDDETVAIRDAAGSSLLDGLPDDNPALAAVRGMLQRYAPDFFE